MSNYDKKSFRKVRLILIWEELSKLDSYLAICMGSSRAVKRHLSTIKDHHEIVGHMFKGKAKNAIENKGKSNSVIE